MQMLEEKLSKLNEMSFSEILQFERDVINSMLDNEDKTKALKQIEEAKWKKSLINSFVEISEGVDFD